MIKIAILDDESHCVESLALHLKGLFPEFPVVFKSSKPREAVDVLKQIEVDLLFLDVEMPVMSGFDVLEQFGELPFDVIFTTAYSQYAVKAFKAQAVNYLLKPIDEDELKEAIEQLLKKRGGPPEKANEVSRLLGELRKDGVLKNKIAIPTREGLEFIEIDSIVYCQAQSNYTQIFTRDGRSHLISRTLKDVEKLLDRFAFIRVHQSYLINPNCMEKYCRNDGGYITMTNTHRIPISHSKRTRVMDMFNTLRGD